MARINVEQKALTDSRIDAFGEALGAPPAFAHAAGLGILVRVWNECQERETKTLAADDLRRITRFENAAAALIESGLGSAVKGGRIRIHGTAGRIEWLANARKKGRTGGRPRKPYGSEKENRRVLSRNIPPAPAPAPAPALKQNLSPAVRQVGDLWNALASEWKKRSIRDGRLSKLAAAIEATETDVRREDASFSWDELFARIRRQAQFFRFKWRRFDLEWLVGANQGVRNAARVWCLEYEQADGAQAGANSAHPLAPHQPGFNV